MTSMFGWFCICWSNHEAWKQPLETFLHSRTSHGEHVVTIKLCLKHMTLNFVFRNYCARIMSLW